MPGGKNFASCNAIIILCKRHWSGVPIIDQAWPKGHS